MSEENPFIQKRRDSCKTCCKCHLLKHRRRGSSGSIDRLDSDRITQSSDFSNQGSSSTNRMD
jgi:hypothetical protein